MATTLAPNTFPSTPSIAASALKTRTWTWQGHSICYTVQGKGKPVVLVHGFGGMIGHWRKNIPVLAEAGYRVYALDLLGFGASAKPEIDYTLDLWKDLLKDFWRAHIQEPTVFVGNSIGALVCLMLVAEHPELCAGGILLNCAGGVNHQSDTLNPILQAVMATFTAVVTSERFGPFLFNQIRRKSQIRRTLRQIYGNREAVTDELVDMIYTPSCDPGAQKVFASILRAPSGPKPQDLLSRIQQPLLVLWGEQDIWAPLATGRKMFQTPPANVSLQFVPIAKTGHCPHDDNPEVVNSLILNWLSEYHINTRKASLSALTRSFSTLLARLVQ